MSHRIGGKPTNDTPSFLHPAQQNLSTNNSADEIERANDEAMKAAINASVCHDDGLTAKQRFARETGDTALIQEANDEALALGLQASLDDSEAAKHTIRPSIPNDEFAAQRGIIAQLKGWLKNHGFWIAPNNGDHNNCLIISILQHVTGDYGSDHVQQARNYKQQVAEWSGGKEKTSSALHSDESLTRRLISQINWDYFGDRKEAYLRFRFVTADLDGNPAIRVMGEGGRIAGILDGAGHYEAFVPSDGNKNTLGSRTIPQGKPPSP